MSGRLISLNPKATYLLTNADPNAVAAQPIQLADLGLKAGDYLALQGEGSFKFGPNSPTVQTLAACFFNGTTRISAGPFGQEGPVETLPTYVGNKPTDVPEDFSVPFDRKLIIRVPGGATGIKFSPNDSRFGDNESVGYGVRISAPNHRRPDLGPPTSDDVEQAANESDDSDSGIIEALRSLPVERSLPTATSFLSSPFSTTDSDATRPHWRSWYLSGWKPRNSHYNVTPVPPFRKHGGWDIFAPRGSKLLAPVGPARMSWLAGVEGFGTLVVFRFSYGGSLYSLVYGHVDRIEGQERDVAAGDLVAYTGCQGNAADENCGAELTSGGFSDHVHVGLYTGVDQIKYNHIDPARLLNWKMITDDR